MSNMRLYLIPETPWGTT